jgi:hypothetical protein
LSTLNCDKCVEDNCPKHDEELVKKTSNGDQDAYVELIRRHHATCINMANHFARPRRGARDEVQNELDSQVARHFVEALKYRRLTTPTWDG